MFTIHHRLLIAAPAATVYSKLSLQEGLAAWWTPQTSATPVSGSIARFGFGPGYFKEMEIVELVPDQRVRWRCRAGAAEWLGTGIGFTLHAAEAGAIPEAFPELSGQAEQLTTAAVTVLVFEHSGWEAATPMFAECCYTWGRFLWSLKLLCETGAGLPWPAQHRVRG